MRSDTSPAAGNASARRAMVSTGLALLLGVAAFLGLRALQLLGSHNHYLELCFILAVVGGPACWWLHRRGGGTRARVTLFAFLAVVSAAFVALRPLPVTTVEVTLREAPFSAELLLAWPIDGGETAHVNATITRGEAPARAVFLLPRPIRERRPPFTLHLGELATPWEIEEVTYGTDFVLRHVSLASFRGADTLEVIRGADSLNRVTLEDGGAHLVNDAGASASLAVLRDATLIRDNTPPARLRSLKGAWLAVYLALAAAVSWPAPLARRGAPFAARLQRFLVT